VGVSERIGNWIQTYSGRKFYPLDPRAEDICIEDIAHALSMKCRYNGHSKHFYSVAEHSVLVSEFVPFEYAMWALLHDGNEAYLPDVPRPLKLNMPYWKPIEDKVQNAVCEHFGLPLIEPPIVKEMDVRICADEKAILLPGGPTWDDMPEPLGALVQALTPDLAFQDFMARYTAIKAGKTGFIYV
jgi:uncharacterized protein